MKRESKLALEKPSHHILSPSNEDYVGSKWKNKNNPSFKSLLPCRPSNVKGQEARSLVSWNRIARNQIDLQIVLDWFLQNFSSSCNASLLENVHSPTYLIFQIYSRTQINLHDWHKHMLGDYIPSLLRWRITWRKTS